MKMKFVPFKMQLKKYYQYENPLCRTEKSYTSNSKHRDDDIIFRSGISTNTAISWRKNWNGVLSKSLNRELNINREANQNEMRIKQIQNRN